MYIYRNDTDGDVIYQLDSWHAASHPLLWPPDQKGERELEAELFQGHLSTAARSVLHTEQKSADLSRATTFVTIASGMSDLCLRVCSNYCSSTRGDAVIRVRGAGVLFLGGQQKHINAADWSWVSFSSIKLKNKSLLCFGGDGVDVDRLRTTGFME